MHYNAKRGIAIACRPSFRLSACRPNVSGSGPQDNIGWKSCTAELGEEY